MENNFFHKKFNNNIERLDMFIILISEVYGGILHKVIILSFFMCKVEDSYTIYIFGIKKIIYDYMILEKNKFLNKKY